MKLKKQALSEVGKLKVPRQLKNLWDKPAITKEMEDKEDMTTKTKKTKPGKIGKTTEVKKVAKMTAPKAKIKPKAKEKPKQLKSVETTNAKLLEQLRRKKATVYVPSEKRTKEFTYAIILDIKGIFKLLGRRITCKNSGIDFEIETVDLTEALRVMAAILPGVEFVTSEMDKTELLAYIHPHGYKVAGSTIDGLTW
jgi:hypothetical protein